MPDTPTMVSLPTIPGETFDLARLNTALDVLMDTGGEREAAYALLHSHNWAATDAVSYSRAAQSCCDNSIDPNEI